MAEHSEVQQAITKISTEIDESQINVILTGQCIKAQAYLLDKLRKQSERYKEVCGFISSANLKLECEIKQAELEIHSLRNALDTIKHANVELRKEYFLAKENKCEMAERISAGEKKYEQLWLESKSRYESIPFVKNFLQTQNKVQTLHDEIAKYKNEAKSLAKEIEIKSDDFKIMDKKRIVELAEFVVHHVPTQIQIIQDNLAKIKDLDNEIDIIEKEVNDKASLANIDKETVEDKTEVAQDKNDAINGDNWASLKDINDDVLMMPTFDESNIDLDFISDTLDKVKKEDMLYAPIEEITVSTIKEKDNQQVKKYDWNVLNMETYMSPYFIKQNDQYITNETRYSHRKLINILEDVNIGKRDAFNILSKVNPQKLQEVNVINSMETFPTLKIKAITEAEVETSCTDNIVVPPTQFLDSQDNIFTSSPPTKGTEQATIAEINSNIQHTSIRSSQEAKKRVSFQLSTSMEISEIPEKLEDCVASDTSALINNSLDTSAVNDEDFVKIKDMVLKKRNLESSPQFVYAKNTMQSTNKPANIVKSKFFEDKKYTEYNNEIVDSGNNEANMDCSDNKPVDDNMNDNENKITHEQQQEEQNKNEDMEVDNVDENKIQIGETNKSTVTGLLFTHGSNALPESLNASMSTTGCEDGDLDFPHYIDSNLLLSPKADMDLGDDNQEVKSQEVPNFLSGLRKTGLSLFGGLLSSTPNTDNNAQNQASGNSFKFSFGGDEKKSRGGFFNMFN